MIAIILNDFSRAARHPARVLLTAALSAGMILIAIFFSARNPSPSPVVYVSEGESEPLSIPGYAIIEADREPPLSTLVSGEYDAIACGSPRRGFTVTTLKGAEYETLLIAALAGNRAEPDGKKAKGPGSTIAGFILMFILMQGTLTLYLFADDKELKILPRIATTPTPISRYLLAHSTFTFFSILISDLAVLYAIHFATGADIGFSFIQYLALFAVAAFLSTGFSLFLNALSAKGDTANMSGSAIVTLTSVLAGSFVSFERGNPFLESGIKMLPQREWLEVASQLERGMSIVDSSKGLLYPVTLSVLFFIIAFLKTKRDYEGAR